MSPANERQLKTGSDPRSLPDYSALRDELAKLSHPARPDVNWPNVEKLALKIFESNGVDLQTAAWYTLARTQLAGIHGFNEGLAILDALIRYQWSAMWPPSAHGRVEILSSLSKRLQQMLRRLTWQRTDLNALYQSEKLLVSTGEALQRQELRTAAGIDVLRKMVQNAAVKLENSDLPADEAHAVVLPADAVKVEAEQEGARWVYVVQSGPAVDVEIKDEKPSRGTAVKAFIGGVLTAAVISVLGFKVIPEWLSHPEEATVMASVADLPSALSAADAARLRLDNPAWLQDSDRYASNLNARLDELGKLPPYWPLEYANRLVAQTQSLYPHSALAKNAQSRWQTFMMANSLPDARMVGWQQGVEKLTQLQNRLNQLDEKKGKYITVSELKTAVYSISQSLNASVPTEELIRQLQEIAPDGPLPQGLLSQTDLQLRQLSNSYMLIKNEERKAK